MTFKAHLSWGMWVVQCVLLWNWTQWGLASDLRSAIAAKGKQLKAMCSDWLILIRCLRLFLSL